MFSREILDFTMKYTMSTGKIFTTDEQRAERLDTLQHAFDCARASLQRT